MRELRFRKVKKIENLFKITHKVELGFKLQTVTHWQEFTPC